MKTPRRGISVGIRWNLSFLSTTGTSSTSPTQPIRLRSPCPRLSHEYERSPVVWVRILGARLRLGGPQCGGFAHPLLEVRVKRGHQVTRRFIVDLPQAGDDRRRSSIDEGAAQADDIIPTALRSHLRLTRAQDNQAGFRQIQTVYLVDFEQPVGVSSRCQDDT